MFEYTGVFIVIWLTPEPTKNRTLRSAGIAHAPMYWFKYNLSTLSIRLLMFEKIFPLLLQLLFKQHYLLLVLGSFSGQCLNRGVFASHCHFNPEK